MPPFQDVFDAGNDREDSVLINSFQPHANLLFKETPEESL